ncbi:hypothetical protein LTR91_005265 [Friedmanniomyces endolithicus]|uniref:Uncharacterized protein n=1 Tax=Friedmanniomyces endolithicus TaxID=329885 RepID=A0A4U0V6Z8_9PEZI|nr:hypothetical protein LTS09_013706 [Friedmanniomyces endolithicus]KAK0336234.1 hypothetical protein LTR94_009683 [Friedmanniomyces endolithicus]KAK0773263.1 hypothetical protein LTR59_015336 [Friedmanniomyces endolithicus]KAK0808273.1 hypothetical protein LTR75_006337 [Friedmanniomyces endolithicus]KAK0810447.1 hypothetical protein LTR38_003932 [Friedmanniomyces endolithicus]
MSAFLRSRALQSARTRAPLCVTRRAATTISLPSSNASSNDTSRDSVDLKKVAKRDPELYILLAIMTGAFSLAGWHFSRNPTSSSSEARVHQAVDSEPWKTGKDAKYQYHPHGDPSKGKKDAPSALNEVIIPNVNLPKSLHEKYNKWGKEGY